MKILRTYYTEKEFDSLPAAIKTIIFASANGAPVSSSLYERAMQNHPECFVDPPPPPSKRAVMTGMACPYCGGSTKYVSSVAVYGRDYGMIYLCLPCDAWVGVHKGTDKALGRLANKELREWKKMAHEAFDPIWRRMMAKGASKFKARSRAYSWLSEQMGLPIDDTHIGLFDVDQCKKVVEVCRPMHAM